MDSPTPLRPVKPPADNAALAKGCAVMLGIGLALLAFWAGFLFITISAFN